MHRVIVTVKRQNEARIRDLEVPAEVAATQLSQLIAQALRWNRDPAGRPVEYEIVAEPPGRPLRPRESLAEAGAWDGAWLVFRPRSASPASVPAPLPPRPPVAAPPSGEGPVVGWQPLDIELPSSQEPEAVGFGGQSPDIEPPAGWEPEPGGFGQAPLDIEPPNDQEPEQDEGASTSDGFIWKVLD